MACAFVLANHFWSHSIIKSLLLIRLWVEIAILVSVNFYFSLLHSVLKNLVPYIGKQPLDIAEHHTITAVFLQEPNYVGFASLFNEILEVSWLGIVDFQLRLDLTHCIDIVFHFSNPYSLILTINWLCYWAKKVSVIWFLKVDGCVEHFIFQYG